MIFSEFEESELFCRFFCLRSSDNDKAIRSRPSTRLIAELGNLDSSRGGGVSQVAQFPFNRSVQFSHEDKLGMMSLNPFNKLMIVEPFIGADQNSSDPFGDLGKTGRQKIRHACGSMGITGPEFSMPEVFGESLKTEKRMIGRSTPFHGIVADPGSFLFSVDGQDRRVDIEDKARGNVVACCHAEQESVMQFAELRQEDWGQPQQEPPQGGGIGIGGQSREISEDTILLQEMSCLKTFDAQDHGVKNGQDRLADTEVVVSLLESKIGGQSLLHSKSSKKSVKEIYASKVSEIGITEGNRKMTGAFGHYNEPYLKSSFRCNPLNSSQSTNGTAFLRCD